MSLEGVIAALVTLIGATAGAAVLLGKWWGEFKTQREKERLESEKAKFEEEKSRHELELSAGKASIENRSKELDNQERAQKLEKDTHNAIIGEYAAILEYRKKEAAEFIAHRDQMITELKEDVSGLHKETSDLQQKFTLTRNDLTEYKRLHEDCERNRVNDRKLSLEQSSEIGQLRKELEEMRGAKK